MNRRINRYLWMAIFFLGVLASAWLAWLANTASPMVWFLVTGVWSAVCGIGFTVSNSLVRSKSSAAVRQASRD